jgi:hypothetical protein
MSGWTSHARAADGLDGRHVARSKPRDKDIDGGLGGLIAGSYELPHSVANLDARGVHGSCVGGGT